MAALNEYEDRLQERVLQPLVQPGRAWLVVFVVLVAVLLFGLYAYTVQLRDGLVVTGMRDRILWGIYISNFVFFIGISHAGTLISAILRTSQAGWRTPVTRMAEFITVVALVVGGLMPMIDLGRPDRIPHLFQYGRWQSPILWDMLAISTYLVGSIAYLYLPMIPDLAIARDRLRGRVSTWKWQLYRSAALGWQDTPRQRRLLQRAMTIMMILIIPIAVSVHTVVSWIFAMTLREPWNSTVFGAFFVAGAIFSGIAVLILVMAALRKIYHLEEYIHERHFIYLGYLIAAMAGLIFYFNVSEYLVTGYKSNEAVSFQFNQMFRGEFAGFFWFYLVGGLLVPVLIVAIPRTRTLRGMVVAAALVTVAMWIERYFIVVASLRIPLMQYEPRDYAPTWVELAITAGAFALFGLLIMIVLRFVPMLAMWEQAEQHEVEESHEAARLRNGTARAEASAPASTSAGGES
ncbi:MAG: NrfD/PsrC family molybdoenzyme membrane anchor subunit [Dehalococcoidia bacterium]